MRCARGTVFIFVPGHEKSRATAQIYAPVLIEMSLLLLLQCAIITAALSARMSK
jgi:hypothetical protein